MRDHPEQQDDEVFVGNAAADGSRGSVSLDDLSTARMGSQAFDIHGNKIPTDHMRPLFIGRSEIHIYNARGDQALKDIRERRRSTTPVDAHK